MKELLLSFTEDFLGTYSADVTQMFDDISQTVRYDVTKLTDQLNSLGFNSSRVPTEFYNYVENNSNVIGKVSLQFHISINTTSMSSYLCPQI